MTMIAREVRERLSEAQNHHCCYCGVTFGSTGPGSMATVEHVRARASGGTNRQANLVMACSRCNGLRGSGNAYQFCERRSWVRETLTERGRVPADYRPRGAERATLAACWPRA